MNLLEKITENLDTVFRGDAWHGPSVMEILNSIPAEKVAQKHQLSKQTITQHVYHLTAWRKFALEKLNDNIHYSLETEDDNWGKDSETTPECFPKLVEGLKKYHGLLLDELEKYNDDLLTKQVPGEYYDYYKLLNGIIQHDTYHLGMIWVIWE